MEWDLGPNRRTVAAIANDGGPYLHFSKIGPLWAPTSEELIHNSFLKPLWVG